MTVKYTIVRTIEESAAFYKSPEWKTLRREFVKGETQRTHGKLCCVNCGIGVTNRPSLSLTESANLEILNVDHIQPLRFFWDRRCDPTNLQILCGPCNKAKGNDTSGINLALAKDKYEASLLNQHPVIAPVAEPAPTKLDEIRQRVGTLNKQKQQKQKKKRSKSEKAASKTVQANQAIPPEAYDALEVLRKQGQLTPELHNFVLDCCLRYRKGRILKELYGSITNYLVFSLKSKMKQ